MRAHFWSHDKDGRHTIRSTIAENSMLHAKFMTVLENRSYCHPKFYIAGIKSYELLCYCDLHLDPMAFIYEPDPYSLEIFRMCKYELHTSVLSNVIIRQIDTTEIMYHATLWVVKKSDNSLQFQGNRNI